MDYKIVPRQDDGTYDLFMKKSNGELDFVKNFDKKEKAKSEVGKIRNQMSQHELKTYVNDLVKALNL